MPFNELHKFDLVDEMHWEDLVEFESLESAGLENSEEFDGVAGAQFKYFSEEEH